MIDNLMAEKLAKIIKTDKWGKSHQKNVLKTYISPTYVQIYKYSQQEVMLNFYALCFTPYASKTNLNLLMQKLLIKR